MQREKRNFLSLDVGSLALIIWRRGTSGALLVFLLNVIVKTIDFRHTGVKWCKVLLQNVLHFTIAQVDFSLLLMRAAQALSSMTPSVVQQ